MHIRPHFPKKLKRETHRAMFQQKLSFDTEPFKRTKLEGLPRNGGSSESSMIFFLTKYRKPVHLILPLVLPEVRVSLIFNVNYSMYLIWTLMLTADFRDLLDWTH
jgi:hypothetical protein